MLVGILALVSLVMVLLTRRANDLYTPISSNNFQYCQNLLPQYVVSKVYDIEINRADFDGYYASFDIPGELYRSVKRSLCSYRYRFDVDSPFQISGLVILSISANKKSQLNLEGAREFSLEKEYEVIDLEDGFFVEFYRADDDLSEMEYYYETDDLLVRVQIFRNSIPALWENTDDGIDKLQQLRSEIKVEDLEIVFKDDYDKLRYSLFR